MSQNGIGNGVARGPIRVVQFGMGPIGQACARVLLTKQRAGHVKLVGAIDVNPRLVGQPVSSLLGGDSDVVVSSDAEGTLKAEKPDVVLHTTTSFLDKVRDQLLLCTRAGVHVISSTEELTFPFNRHPDISRDLDQEAKKYGVVILGTGVNPGYAMDTLALAATGVSTSAERIEVTRIVDASKRREPLQRKIGAGITVQEFNALKAGGTFGHIGLRESLEVVAAGLRWALDEMEETLEPVVAEAPVQSEYFSVDAGQVAGIHQVAIGRRAGVELIRLTLKMYLGAKDPVDRVLVHGTPPIDLMVKGGIFGDTATVGSLINAIPGVMTASPGLHTVITMPVPRAFGV